MELIEYLERSMTQTVAVASGKGGVGKTFVVSNLSIILARANFKVLLIDADVRLANLELLYGLEECQKTLQDVLKGSASIEEVIYSKYGVDVIPAGLSVESLYVNVAHFERVLQELLGMGYDYIVIDCPAGLNEDIGVIFMRSDYVVLVTNPEIPAVTDAMKVKYVAEHLGTPIKGVVVNMVGKAKGEIPKHQLERVLGKVIGVIPFEADVGVSISKGIPYVLYKPESKITRCFGSIVEHLTGIKIEIKEEKKRGQVRKGKSIFGFLI